VHRYAGIAKRIVDELLVTVIDNFIYFNVFFMAILELCCGKTCCSCNERCYFQTKEGIPGNIPLALLYPSQ
jgi:hypothetical protein